VRVGSRAGLASRGAQGSVGPATDLGPTKRGGRGAEAPPRTAGVDHGEAQAQEGQVGRWSLNVALRRGPILAWMKTLKTNKDATPGHPR